MECYQYIIYTYVALNIIISRCGFEPAINTFYEISSRAVTSYMYTDPSNCIFIRLYTICVVNDG